MKNYLPSLPIIFACTSMNHERQTINFTEKNQNDTDGWELSGIENLPSLERQKVELIHMFVYYKSIIQ